QIPDELLAEVRGRREAERDDVARQGKIVVDRLGHVGDGETRQDPGQLRGGVGGVVAPDGDQVVHVQLLEGGRYGFDTVGRARGIRARRAHDRAALEVDA